MTDTNKTPDKAERRINDLQSDDPKKVERARAQSEDEQNKTKRKAEGKQAQWTSPEEVSLSGHEVYPEQKVTPDKPDPSTDPQVQAMIKAREQKK